MTAIYLIALKNPEATISFLSFSQRSDPSATYARSRALIASPAKVES
jgi:hypothetical protein